MISSVACGDRRIQQIGDQGVGGVKVEVLSGLVDDEHREVGEQRPGECEPLALAAGDLRPVGADPSLEPGGQSRDPLQQPRPVHGVAQLRPGGVAPGEAQVLLERRVEDVRVLGHETDDAPVLVTGQLGDRRAVERDRATLVGQESQQHIGERRLPGPAAADDRDASA